MGRRQGGEQLRQAPGDVRRGGDTFADPRHRLIADPDHSTSEERWLLLGVSAQGRLLVVAHTERGDRIRIISARAATARELRAYG